jgi:hypothetical protein
MEITLINKIKIYWLNLDPSVQYMSWIITLCLILVSSIFLLLAIEGSFGFSTTLFNYIMICIVGFATLFCSTVLFLTVYWPFKYQDVK